MTGNVVSISSAPLRARKPAEIEPYAELAVTTNFSFLRGASSPEELVEHARDLGLTGIGIADRNSVAGVVCALTKIRAFAEKEKERQENAAKKILSETVEPVSEIKLAVGSRLVFSDGTPDILAYPCDRAGWGRLTRLLSLGKGRAEKGDCILGLPDLLDHIEGLNLIVMPPVRIHAERLGALLVRLKGAAPRSVWLAASMLYRGDDARRLERLVYIADRAFLPLIAVNDVLYHAPQRRELQDVITCIREHLTLEDAGWRLEANAERVLKPPREMSRLFRNVLQAIRETQHFLNRCNFSLEELRNTEYADEIQEGYATPHEALTAFCEKGIKTRFSQGIPAEIRNILDGELKLVGELDYAPFFLTVYEIINYARSLTPPILCQGRGSAANSLICYCLGITEVAPKDNNLLFERFVSKDRGEPPDIDVDFEHERREEIIQHIYEKYGRERAGIAATVIRYRGRSAIREVGKVFGLSSDAIAALASTLWGWSSKGVSKQEARRLGLDPSDDGTHSMRRIKATLTSPPCSRRGGGHHPG